MVSCDLKCHFVSFHSLPHMDFYRCIFRKLSKPWILVYSRIKHNFQLVFYKEQEYPCAHLSTYLLGFADGIILLKPG